MLIPGLARYLEDLSVHLRLDPLRERQVIREMYTHLADRVAELETEGLPRHKAVEEAIASFGKPRAVAHAMQGVHAAATWLDAALAAAPYLFVSLIFALHLWDSLPWLMTFMVAAVGVTLIGWWRRKPPWLYTWAGYALVLPLVTGIIAGAAVGNAGWRIIHGQDTLFPLWVIGGLLIYIPLSLSMLVSVLVRVIHFDWVYASLMLLPFPVLARWMLSLQVEGSALSYPRAALDPGNDAAIALVFLALALLPVIVMRLPNRPLKIVALILATPPSFLIAAYHTPGYTGLWGMLLFVLLSVLLLLSPAYLDRKVGRGSHSHRQRLGAWAEDAVTES